MSKVCKWSDMWTSCSILLCVIQNNQIPPPPPLHPFRYTQVLSVKLTDRMGVSVHPVQSHASLCHSLLHVHTKTVDELICVCVLASLLFVFCLILMVCFIVFVWCGWELVLQTKKTAQLPLKDNGTVIDKVRTCIKCCWRVHFLYNWISHVDGWMLLFCILNRLLSSFCHVYWILQLFLKCWFLRTLDFEVFLI